VFDTTQHLPTAGRSQPTNNGNVSAVSQQQQHSSVFNGGGNSTSNIFTGSTLNELTSLGDSLSPACVNLPDGTDKNKNGLVIGGLGDLENSSSGLHTLLSSSSIQQQSSPFPQFIVDNPLTSNTNNIINTNKNITSNILGNHQNTNTSNSIQQNTTQQNFSFNNSIRTGTSSNSSIFPSEQTEPIINPTKLISATAKATSNISNSLNNTSTFTNIGGFNQNINASISSVNSLSNVAPNVQLVNNQGQLINNSQQSPQLLSSSIGNQIVQNGQVLQGTRIINSGTQYLSQPLLNSTNPGFLTPSTTIPSQNQTFQNAIQLQSIAPQQSPSVTKSNTPTFRAVSSNKSSTNKSAQNIKPAVSISNIQSTAATATQSSNVMLQQLQPIVIGNNQQNNAIKPILQTHNGQLIQLLSGTNRISNVVSSTPKLIQPKQPQLLPKPIVCGNNLASSSQINIGAKNLGSTIIASRPVTTVSSNTISTVSLPTTTGQSPAPTLMTLNGSNQTLIGGPNQVTPNILTSTSNATNSAAPGSLILNGGILQGNIQGLQSGIQQPVIVQHPNGIQYLVKPANTAPSPFILNSGPQFLLNPAQTVQPTNLNGNKTNSQPAAAVPPQAIMIPGANGQPATFVVPQGLTQNIATPQQTLNGTSPNIVGAANTRNVAPNQGPIYRILPQQPPTLQLQQINTPSGPQFIVVPSNTTALNLPAGTVLGGGVRPLAPQIQTPTIQIGSQQIQVPGQPHTLQIAPAVSLTSSAIVPGSISLPNSSTTGLMKNSTDNTGTLTTQSLNVTQPSILSSSFTNQLAQPNRTNSQLQVNQPPPEKKKKSKKKKKEPKSPAKKNLINLNDILKETGILGESFSEDADLASLTVEDDLNNVPGCSGIGDSNTFITGGSLDNNFTSNPTVSFSVMPLTSSSTTTAMPQTNYIVTPSSSTNNVTNLNNLPSGSTSNFNTLLGMPSVSNIVMSTNVNNPNNTITTTSSSLPNNLIQQNVLNVTSGVTPQVLGSKLGTPGITSNVVATLDSQGKLVLGSLGPIKPNNPVLPNTSTPNILSSGNGIFMNLPMQIPSSGDSMANIFPSNSMGQIVINNSQSNTNVILNSTNTTTTSANISSTCS